MRESSSEFMSEPMSQTNGSQIKGGQTKGVKQPIWINSLQWFIGLYIAIRGTLMLMLPHTLNTHVFVPIQSNLPWLGAWQVTGGTVLIAAVTLMPRRSIVFLAHLIAGSALLQAAYGHFLAGTWTAVADFSVLGMGTAIAPFLERRHSPYSKRGIDLFALLTAIRMILDGIIVLLPFNPQFEARLYDPVRPYLLFYGIAYGVCGLMLLAVYFYPKLPKWSFQVAHGLAGAMLWSWTIGLGLPTWNSVLFYGGFGTVLALLPWLSSRLRQFDSRSLQTQLAVTLVGIVALPLLFAVALIALPQERTIINQALTLQRTLATTIAQDTANYINLHQAAVHALSRQPNLATMTAQEQRTYLQTINQLYPDITTFTTYDAAGDAIARSDNRPLSPPISSFDSYRAARQGQPTLNIRIGRVIQKPILTFTAPFYDADQQFAGAVAGAIESAEVTQSLIDINQNANLLIYLVDEQGRVIAHPDATLVSQFADYSQVPPVAALLRNEGMAEGLQYWNETNWQLAGYALVPNLGWGVVIERPASEVLASLNARRNRDFQTLLVVALIALIIGWQSARRLSNSLTALAYATNQLASGNTQAPLPQSSVTEIARLSYAFALMRDRLSRRTAERDQMEQDLADLLHRERQSRTEAETANRIKDEFLAVLSHELRTPLNPILGWSRMLRSRQFDEETTNRALETIERNAKLQTQLIEDLLDVSRILQGKLRLTHVPIELSVIITAAIETVGLAANTKSIAIQTEFDPDVGKVSGDPGRLQQVIWNLLSNAVKFTPTGGRVEVRLNRVEPSGENNDGTDRQKQHQDGLQDGSQDRQRSPKQGKETIKEVPGEASVGSPDFPSRGYAQITITDTGQGIDPEFLPYVFDTFRQADGATTRQFGGLGLGLAIARHIMELHHGTITASSAGKGQGATFVVRLPLLHSPTQPQQPSEIHHLLSSQMPPLHWRGCTFW